MNQQKSADSPAASELGELFGEYTFRGSRVQMTWTILALPFLIYAFPAAAAGLPLGFVLVPAAIGFTLLGLTLLRNPCVCVYAEGFALLKGQRVDICFWNEVETVWQDLTVGQATLMGVPIVKGPTMHRYRVRRRDGREFRFEENFKNVAALGESIRKFTFPRLHAEASATLDRGELVELELVDYCRQALARRYSSA